MIFHLSRCGSTLVSRLLGTLPGVVVVAEPSPLNALLGLDPARVDAAALVQIVRLLVRALGRRRHGDEQHLVLKCTSWNIRRQEILAAAFPDTPWVWVQRDPAHVVASLLANPPGWLGLGAVPPQTALRFGVDPAALPTMTRPEFAARALGAMLLSAAAGPGRRICVDHADLPAAVWDRVAAHFGIEIDAAAIERMTEQSRFYSKDVESRTFSGDRPEHRPVTDEMQRRRPSGSPSPVIACWRRDLSRPASDAQIDIGPSSFQSHRGVLKMLMKIMFITVSGGLS